MEALKKHATKFRDQVAKKQQAVWKHLGHVNEGVVMDESELETHQQLQDLYASTKAAKHLQRNIVHGLEGFISTSSKLMEIARKLAEDCHKYGEVEDKNNSAPLARAALNFGTSHKSMEDERETLLTFLAEQVSVPLSALVNGAPLEDARHLVNRYERVRQDVEAQAADIMKRRLKTKESEISEESYLKLKSAEARLTQLKSALTALGREASAAMLSVEDNQQKTTHQRLLALVDAERSYHRHAVTILDQLYSEMIMEDQLIESSSQDVEVSHLQQQSIESNGNLNQQTNPNDSYFLAKVVHPFDAEAEGELSLCVDDYVMVRKVAQNGWSEGESNGKIGSFPSAYVEKTPTNPDLPHHSQI